MNYKEVVDASREYSEWAEANIYEVPIMLPDVLNAADMLTELRNELCCRCGQYKEAHNGACDGCKWRDG